ncbi:MAG: iron transporter [Rhodocyclaceae bacterium]|nr:iron transporter [Rhodocyclaceae bacterium]
MSPYHLATGAVVVRTLLASVGGYALALSFTVGGSIVVARSFGMARSEAIVLAAMLAFLVWMLAVLIAFAATTTWRAAVWILGSAASFALLGWGLGPLQAPGGI